MGWGNEERIASIHKQKETNFVMLECAISKKKFDVSSKKSVPFLVVLYQSFHINTISLGLYN